MNVAQKMIMLSLCLAVLPLGGAFAEDRNIPDLPWEKRSDWIDVKTDVMPAAKGDGIADDTEALQAAFKMIKPGSTLYISAGTYRITKTINLGGGQKNGGIAGGTIIGNGRSTKIVWDGEPGGIMVKSLGYTHSSYIGFVLDGRGKAATGLLHAGYLYETDMLYRHVAFLNFTGDAVSIGRKHDGNLETAEVLFENCLFEHCETGVNIGEYNDYDNCFASCEFRDCAQGIVVNYGNAYIRDCHFERSTVRDILSNGSHSASIRRCTSLDSRLFLEYSEATSPLTLQDCRIDGWYDRRGAILLNGAPVVMFDCVFGNPSTMLLPEELRERFPIWPVKIIGKETQRLIISNNIITVKGKQEPLTRKSVLGDSPLGFECGRVYEIPAGERKGSLTSAKQSFLKTSVPVPSKIFDAKRDFGAKGDNKTDDTEAIQKTIDAARAHSKDALAYLPSGSYYVSKTLEISGSNYRFGGASEYSRIDWKGADGGAIV
ncbi:MAG: glycosyl hydrolase family 28-related protein, partial [Lentisphaerota bacterium]